MRLPASFKWIGLALLGLLIATAVALAATSLISRQIGMTPNRSPPATPSPRPSNEPAIARVGNLEARPSRKSGGASAHTHRKQPRPVWRSGTADRTRTGTRNPGRTADANRSGRRWRRRVGTRRGPRRLVALVVGRRCSAGTTGPGHDRSPRICRGVRVASVPTTVVAPLALVTMAVVAPFALPACPETAGVPGFDPSAKPPSAPSPRTVAVAYAFALRLVIAAPLVGPTDLAPREARRRSSPMPREGEIHARGAGLRVAGSESAASQGDLVPRTSGRGAVWSRFPSYSGRTNTDLADPTVERMSRCAG